MADPKIETPAVAPKAPPVQVPPPGHELFQNVSDVTQVVTIGGEQHVLRPARFHKKTGVKLSDGETIYARPADVVKIPSLRPVVLPAA